MDNKPKISQWTFIKDLEPSLRPDGTKKDRMSIFRFSCGVEYVRNYNIINRKNGSTRCQSCAKAQGWGNTTHNLGKHPLYRKWADMKNRCYNKSVDRYPIYGGRGIKVCATWNKDFNAFHDFCVSKGWTKGMSLERIDVNGDYEPNNCTIIPLSEQHYNKQNTFYVEHDGVKYCLVKLLKYQGKGGKYKHIHKCLKSGLRTFQYFIPIYNITFPEPQNHCNEDMCKNV